MSQEDRHSAASVLRRLCDSALSLVFETDPFSATLSGIPGWDSQVPQVTLEHSAKIAVAARSIAAEAAALKVTPLDPVDRVTRAVLIHEMSVAAEVADLRCVEFDTAPFFVAPHCPVLQLMPKTVLADAEQAESFLCRLSGLPGYLDSSADQLIAGTAAGRTPAYRSLAGSIQTLESYLASTVDADLLHVPAPPAWRGSARFEERRTALVRDHVRPALGRLSNTYRELLATARPDTKLGVCWLPDGEHLYEVLARQSTSADLDPQALHQLGIDVLEELKEEYADIGHQAIGTSDMAEVLNRMRNDASFRLESVEQLFEITQAALRRCRVALPEWFGHLPASECALKRMPDHEGKTATLAYYLPANGDNGSPGTYWVNGNDVQRRPKHDVEAIAFHEAIPGHHLQFAIAQQSSVLPLYRRSTESTAYIEGWGLYAERLADEMDLYSSPLQRLGMLQCDSWRASRLVVDSGIHAAGWSFEKAVQFMVDNTSLPLSVILREVDRYVGSPGQALGYMVGRLEIDRIRGEAVASLGDRFDIRAFHDTVLGTGTVPLAVLESEVRRWSAQRLSRT